MNSVYHIFFLVLLAFLYRQKAKDSSTIRVCYSFSYLQDAYKGDGTKVTYSIAVVNRTTDQNCGNNLSPISSMNRSKDELGNITQDMLNTRDDHNLPNWCFKYSHSGTWWAEVRFLQLQNESSCYMDVWKVSCESR